MAVIIVEMHCLDRELTVELADKQQGLCSGRIILHSIHREWCTEEEEVSCGEVMKRTRLVETDNIVAYDSFDIDYWGNPYFILDDAIEEYGAEIDGTLELTYKCGVSCHPIKIIRYIKENIKITPSNAYGCVRC